MTKPTRKGTHAADPSRHTQPRRARKVPTRRVGASPSELGALPRVGGNRNAVPKRPNEGQPPGHVGRR